MSCTTSESKERSTDTPDRDIGCGYQTPVGSAHVTAQMGGFLIAEDKVVGFRWVVNRGDAQLSADGGHLRCSIPTTTAALLHPFALRAIKEGNHIDLFVFPAVFTCISSVARGSTGSG